MAKGHLPHPKLASWMRQPVVSLTQNALVDRDG